MCGEQLSFHKNFLPSVGSPPRVRGTGTAVAGDSNTVGITPACAGNSIIPWLIKQLYQDHPRVCGEQRTRLPAASREAGSPPRVRGTADQDGDDYVKARITPACAGNRPFVTSFLKPVKDHPRVCGEQPPRGLPSGRW